MNKNNIISLEIPPDKAIEIQKYADKMGISFEAAINSLIRLACS